MIARNDDEATRGARRPRGGDQLHAEAAKSVMKGVLIASLSSRPPSVLVVEGRKRYARMI